MSDDRGGAAGPLPEELARQLDDDAEVVDEIVLPPAVPQVAGGRSEARERAVHLLYESRMKARPGGETVADQVAAPDAYAVDLVRGVEQHRTEIDEVIGRLARGWTIERMPSLDLEVLRVACFELAHRPDVPTGVVLSEAVDLATRYGTDDSSRFVNGLLAAAARELRPEG
ncbi:transcription antitermination factor NusB [Dermatobacter hominis]|uniref:transcription antitermination factor NusB n=1 Tax=Dermatobacter hominis TaxID=2884263 RepID=UPI001D0F4C4C|nr:transcription antitermination factor NusB [Dermatobacter hominis]UDY36189.1 transcription antitermination factor NusB [Dermatobacter hominis]